MRHFIYTFLLLYFSASGAIAQPIPADDENIPHLVTFGKFAETSWGDDDFSQVFFFSIPESFRDNIYIRIYDPDCGGKIDELNGYFNTKTEFSVYGGKDCWSDEDAQGLDPVGNYKSGILLDSETFGVDSRYDDGWFTFGPFNPRDGELSPDFGYIFKIICEGISGDDGNLYRFFLSISADENIEIEGGNAFCYEYTFRMWNVFAVSHIYPFIDKGTTSVKQKNFDWDSDGILRIVSTVRRGELGELSGEDFFTESEHRIINDEIGKSLDFQFIKKHDPLVINNNVVISVQNQYDENLRFFTIPIGGVPKYNYNIETKKIEK